MIAAKEIPTEEFLEIFKNIHEKDFGTLGQIRITYNPEKLGKLLKLPEDKRIGFEGGEGYFQVEQVQKHLAEPIAFLLQPVEEEVCFLVTTYFQASLGFDAKFSHDESLNHPLSLSWVQFMSKQDRWLEAEVIENLSSGKARPSILSIEDGLRLLKVWIHWLEKYVE